MIYIYTDNSEVTSTVSVGSLGISQALQQRSDTAKFSLVSGSSAPSENDDVQIYKGTTISNIASTTLTLDPHYQTDVNYFFAGQELRIRIGDSDEETVAVSSYTESTNTLILTASPSGVLSVGDKIGILMFGGVISRVADRNVQVLDNLEYDISCTDYTKIFNKKLVNDTFEDVDSRYLINGFVNSTVNYNKNIDTFDYTNVTALRAVWAESGDGDNPILEETDFIEGDSAGELPWTFSSGTATFTATLNSQDYSIFTGANSGTPSKGAVMIWMDPSDYTKITSVTLKIGSDSSNYSSFSLDVPTKNDWTYNSKELVNGTITGTPDWQAADYAEIIIVQTASASITFNGLRINNEDSFTMFNVDSTPVIDDYRIPFTQPMAVMQQLSKTWSYIWYIDYLRDIHFVDAESVASPFSITDTSDNFTGLKTDIDQSTLGNRIVVQGGESTSSSVYSQVFRGDNTVREWLVKSKFKNLEILVDNNSSTDTMEATTTTTTVKATAHGLLVNDHVVMRSRDSVVRQVLTVPDLDSFTVEAVTSQASGDIFSKFSVTKTDGVEGLVDDTSVDYVYNSNSRSIRATASEDTFTDSEFVRFAYNERIPIQYQYTDSASADSLKARGLGDGIFDLDKYTDNNIDSQSLAIQIAQARVSEYSNPIISGGFKTDQTGLKTGQILTVNDSNRSADVNDNFLIQKLTIKQRGGEFFDYFEYKINFGTTLFGTMEFFQKLLATKDKIAVNADAVVSTFVDSNEIVESSDVNSVAKEGDENAKNTEIVESSDVNQAVDFPKGTWRWEPNGVGQPLATRWNLFDWG